MGREGAKDKKFFVKMIPKEDSGALTYETYYTNIRTKKKLIEEFEKQIEELGHCEETVFLTQHCETLQKEIDTLMDLFRGRLEAKGKKILYIPMDIEHAFDYMGFLINTNVDKHIDTIRNLINAIEYETGETMEDRKQMGYYQKLIKHFKKSVNKMPVQRVLCCFDCKVYVPIHLNNIESARNESWFRTLHSGHRTQIVGLDELEPKSKFDTKYTLIKR